MKGGRRGIGKILMAVGLILVLAAAGLTAYNVWDEQRAESVAAEIETQLAGSVAVNAPPVDAEPDYKVAPNMEMPVVTINGVNYIGTVTIPALGRELPVVAEWSEAGLKLGPCRYTGSAYLDDMIICGHNYRSHFAGLKNLQPGDEVIFTDADGNVFNYEVRLLETIGKYQVEEMQSGEWDLTIFTCTLGGQTRVTVRCDRVSDVPAIGRPALG